MSGVVHLVGAGKPASLPVAVVENASLPSCRILHTTLGGLPALVAAAITGPALMLLGPQFAARAVHRAPAAAPWRDRAAISARSGR